MYVSKILATALTLESLERLVNEFYYSKGFSIKIPHVIDPRGQILPGVKITQVGKRFRFEMI